MKDITIEGPTSAALLQELHYQCYHGGETRQPCIVKGCPAPSVKTYGDRTASVGGGIPVSLCAWHDEAWGRFLEEWEKRTGKGTRLGKYGNWDMRFRKFLEWAERDPKDRMAMPGPRLRPAKVLSRFG